jgi:glycosyltransferase involved in cell wall biosynthesis
VKKILILVNHDVVVYNFRLEIVERFIRDGHDVHISSPYGERIDDLIKLGAKFYEIKMNRHGMNPKEELRILSEYKKLMKEVKPDICFGFTIKPNIYGAIAARKYSIPFVANITGLGTAVENPGFSQKISIILYKYAFKKIQRLFFQNEENKKFFDDHGLAKDKGMIIPGSGVNLERYPYRKYPDDGTIKFAFISRIMKEKGIDQYLNAAEAMKGKNVEFHVCGFCEPEYDGRLQEEHKKGVVNYHGMIRDVAGFMGAMHCIIHPTYYPEGMSNVLLEACATGRPIITTDRSGCREVVDDCVNGYMIPCQSSEALIAAVKKFLRLNWKEKKAMGVAARKKVEEEFDRQIVVEKYVEEVNKA